jgi:hypothetical protein
MAGLPWPALARLLRLGRAVASLTVIPKLVVPIGREAIAMADRPADIASVRGGTLSRAGLCVMIVNSGVEPVTVVEIGLSGRFGQPRIVMRVRLLHDNKSWPRRLRAGETVIAYFAHDVAGHHVLPAMRRAFATSLEGASWSGASPALSWYVRSRKPAWLRRRRFTASDRPDPLMWN